MPIAIDTYPLGMLNTNAYMVTDEDTRNTVLIDPVDMAEQLVNVANSKGYRIQMILATHAHFDHVLASQRLVELTGAPFYLHEEAAPYLDNLPQTGVRFTGQPFPPAAIPDKFLQHGEIIQLDNIRLESRYTPGHAPGHLSFYLESENVVFSGDALFAGSIGRTDLEGGSHPLLIRSIKTQLMTLADDVRVLPGHMSETTIGYERRTNPYLR